MRDRYYNPFQTIDIFMPEPFREVFARYCQTGADGGRSVIDESPFPRMVDLWFLGVCWAVRLDLQPTKVDRAATYKVIEGSVFANDPCRVYVLMLLAVARTGDAAVVARPRDVMALATGLAVAGLPHVEKMLQRGDDKPIWNLSDALTESLATSRPIASAQSLDGSSAP